MNNNGCFETTSIKLSDNNPIFTDHKNWDYEHKEVTLYDTKNTFLRCSVPTEYFEGEPMYDLMKEYNLGAKIFKMDPGTVYNWHRDVWRNYAFNLLLTDDSDYLTIFAHDHPAEQDLSPSKFMYVPITQVVYEPKTFHLLNARKPHAIVNYSKTTRYLLTVASWLQHPVVSIHNKVDPAEYINMVNTLDGRGLIVTK